MATGSDVPSKVLWKYLSMDGVVDCQQSPLSLDETACNSIEKSLFLIVLSKFSSLVSEKI